MSDWTDAPTLSGRHVTLRPLVRDDVAELATVLRPLVGQFTTTVPLACDDADPWFARIWTEQAAGRCVPFAVLDADGRLAGSTRFMRMAPAHGRLEIGGTLYAPRVQRTGLNTEAKRLLLTHAFEVLGAHVVQLRTDWLNQRSRRAIERLGARLDGVLRGHLVMSDGHRRDTVVYSILDSEWPGVRSHLDMLLRRHDGEPT